MGKHSKTTTDDISQLRLQTSLIESQISDLYSLVRTVRSHLKASREYGAKAINDLDGRINELSERMDVNGLDMKEEVSVESLRLPDDYQRAEMLRLAASAGPHPDQIVPMAQKFLAFVSGGSTVNPSEQARKVDLINAAKRDFVTDLLADYEDLSDSASVNVGRVRAVLRRAAGLS